MYEFCTAEPKKIASILRFLPFGPVGAPPGLSFNGFRPASYPVSSVLGRRRGKGERPSGSKVSGPRHSGCGCSGSGHPVTRFRSRRVGCGCFGPGVRLRRRSGLSMEALRSRRVGRRVPGPRLSGCGVGRGSPSRRSGRGCSGHKVPWPRRSGYSFSVWGSSLTETSRVLFSRSACGSGLLVHSSQSRRRCVMSMAA